MTAHYTHVIFDLDGTVYDSNHANMAALADALNAVLHEEKYTADSLKEYNGVSAQDTFTALGIIDSKQREALHREWFMRTANYADEIVPFKDVIAIMRLLKKNGIKIGIATSRDHLGEELLGDRLSPFPLELHEFVDIAVCVDDVAKGKPAPDMLLKFLELSGASKNKVLFVGDTADDFACAQASGIDFALAMWGYAGCKSLSAQHFLITPYDIATVALRDSSQDEIWFKWAREIQAIGQIGLAYTKNVFDIERFERLREIACEMMALKTGQSLDVIKDSFAFDKGYACPKVDTRAAVFNAEGKILMVREAMSGKWDLPGGWCDENETIVSNTLKELREEACMIGLPKKLIAVLDRNRHNIPKYSYGVLKVFIECLPGEHHFSATDETLDCKYFAFDEIPFDELRLGTNTKTQLELCFAAHNDEHWTAVIE